MDTGVVSVGCNLEFSFRLSTRSPEEQEDMRELETFAMN